ncbi:hypothetical protein ACI2KR_07805 [Pseudomonas luteola]
MSVAFNGARQNELNTGLIKDVINNATFSTEDVIAKGAIQKPKSRFAAPEPVDERFMRINAKMTMDIGQLPVAERHFIIDTFDRVGDYKNGKLSVGELVQKTDFDSERVEANILSYLNKKIDKALGLDLDKKSENAMNALPEHIEVGVSEQSKKGIMNWLKQNLGRQSEQPSLGR